MTEIRKIVYAYLQLPYHQKVKLQQDYGVYDVGISEHDRDKRLFEVIKEQNKLSELKAVLTPLKQSGELGNEAKKEASGKSFEDTLPFIEWYSGMEGVKIRHAYERYCREVLK